jgi:hypothetical protein
VRIVLAAVAVALVVPAVAFAKSRVYLEDTVPSGSSTSVTITTHKAASFSVRLRVPTAGRAKLFLLAAYPHEQHVVQLVRLPGRGGIVLLHRLVRAAAEGDVHVAHHVGERDAGRAEDARPRRAHRPLVSSLRGSG